MKPSSGIIIKTGYKATVIFPIPINQWANVVRWEMRTRLFLTEFFGRKAIPLMPRRGRGRNGENAECICWVCRKFHGCSGDQSVKTANERFAGAEDTYCIEALMQDDERHCRPVHRISWVRILQKHSMCSSWARRINRNLYGPPVGALAPGIGALIMAHAMMTTAGNAA